MAAALAASPQFDPAGLSADEQVASRHLLAETWAQLPPRWRAGLDPRLQLRWRDDLPTGVHGRARGRHIGLHRRLLAEWMARPAADAPAVRALIHELAHAWDHSPQGGLSRDPRLLDLAGWQLRPLRLGLRSPRNPFTDRSPDRYELENPREFVAVNLEWFLLDPQYACRRPALQRYFSAHFGWSPAASACAPALPFLAAGPEFAAGGFEWIDPARVYAVDYLLAEPEGQAMSRWGHSMLRLVICAPGRVPGPDCRLDLQHHRVLSFRAFVGDVQISSWRGLTGRYPSRLFLLPLDQVIDEYTQVELRGLQSIPLRLTREELGGLLERAAQLHWSYDGRYYFIDNNCAVETWRLLYEGAPRLAALPLRSVTPTGLLRRLQRAGVADAGVLADPAQARRQGYYFESMRSRYQAMFALAQASLSLPQARLEDWLELSPEARARWLQAGDLQVTAALLVLEEAAQRRSELRARAMIKRQLLGRGEGRAARTQMQALLAEEALLLRPAALGEGGYGLPQQELAALEMRAQAVSAQVGGEWQRLHALAEAALPAAQQQALHGIKANLDTLGARLRALHRAQGGLELR